MKKNNLFEILFSDSDIIVISKPSGLLTIPDRYNKSLPSLNRLLVEEFGEIFTVHRLDRDTSGVIIFGKNADAHRILNTQFENQSALRIYHAVVSGTVLKDEIDIDIPLGADSTILGKSIPSARGKESLTKLKVLERFRNSTLVELNLVTGRHHQIRAHTAAIGHSLLIDDLYGKKSQFMLSEIKRKFNLKKHDEEKPLISRITMHAYSLTIKHPVSNSDMTFTSNYPKDFEALISVLRKYGKLH